MSFTANQNHFTAPEHNNAALREIIGGHELLLSFTGKVMAAKDDPYWLVVHSGLVIVQTKHGALDLGYARPPMPHLIRQFSNAGVYQFEMNMPLSPIQLSALENHRDGGNIEFEVRIVGESGRGQQRQDHPEHCTIRIPCPQSKWIEQLNAARARAVFLLEVSSPVVKPSTEQAAIHQHLIKAAEGYALGRYTDCVAEARKTLETLRSTDERFDWTLLKNQESREEMTSDQRFEALKAMTHLFANPSAHSVSRGGYGFSRADARLAMTLVTALIGYQ